MPSSTYFRIWKTPLNANRVVGHAPTLALTASHSGKLFPSALPSPDHRKHEVNPCRPVIVKVAYDIAGMELAQLIPFQDDVIPAPAFISQCNGAKNVSRPLGKPFNLLADKMLQIAVQR